VGILTKQWEVAANGLEQSLPPSSFTRRSNMKRLNTKACVFITSATAAAGIGAATNAIGPDVILHDIPSVLTFGPIGGTWAYILGGGTCNIGTQNHEWQSSGSPGLAMNAYRLFDGRLEQIGQGFPKHACCVVNGPGCTGLTCQAGGTGLRVGCRDVYGASFNSNQARLGPRSGINAFTGQFTALPGGTGDAIFRRMQIAQADMEPATYPGALFFVEGVFVGTGDATAANWLNNATYQRATFTNFQLALVPNSLNPMIPAIFAWRDHGNGPNAPDLDVKLINVDVPSEGRFIAGAKARDNGDGTWRYDYAIYNLNSDRSGGSFTVPVPTGVVVSNVGFHDVNYHSGEPYANTDWTVTPTSEGLTWSSPQTFEQNANSNALRWGTMYNFWFTADAAPAEAGVQATLGLFKPHTPQSVAFNVSGPGVQPCPADIEGSNGVVNIDDLLLVLNNWGAPDPGNPADVDGDGDVDIDDLLAVINAWGPC
jgi:hypothetical protein